MDGRVTTRRRRRSVSPWGLLFLLSGLMERGEAFHAPVTRLPATRRQPVAGWPGASTGRPRKAGMRMAMDPLRLVKGSDAFAALPPEKVIAAVRDGGGRVTAQDVAALVGVDLKTAEKGLAALAAVAQGDLEVSEEGVVVYSFPEDFEATLWRRSVLQRGRKVWSRVWPSLFSVSRTMFGAAIVGSAFLVATALVSSSSSSSSSGDPSSDDPDERRRRGRPRFSTTLQEPPSREGATRRPGSASSLSLGRPSDVFRPYGYYYQPGRSSQDARSMGFYEACSSYVFGDGDPNGHFEEERLSAIARAIRENGGAVVAEQLAPYLDTPPPPSEEPDAGGLSSSVLVDESYMLPVLTRLNGRPEVTPEGHIVYVFPDLMTSALPSTADTRAAASPPQLPYLDQLGWRGKGDDGKESGGPDDGGRRRRDRGKYRLISTVDGPAMAMTPLPPAALSGEAPLHVQEKEAPFSLASKRQRMMAGAFGLFNLGGLAYLGHAIRSAAVKKMPLPAPLALVAAMYGPLMTFAVGYNVIPAVRGLRGWWRNRGVRRRNRGRRRWAAVVRRTRGALARKVMAARRYRSRMKLLRKEDAVYSTQQQEEKM